MCPPPLSHQPHLLTTMSAGPLGLLPDKEVAARAPCLGSGNAPFLGLRILVPTEPGHSSGKMSLGPFPCTAVPSPTCAGTEDTQCVTGVDLGLSSPLEKWVPVTGHCMCQLCPRPHSSAVKWSFVPRQGHPGSHREEPGSLVTALVGE